MSARARPVGAPAGDRATDEGLGQQRALETLISRLIASPATSEAALRDVAERAGLDRDAVAWLCAQPLSRLMLYPDLARERVVRALCQMMPMVAAQLGERFELACRTFARRGQHASRFPRDLAWPFLRAWREGELGGGWPPWAFDLARHETATVEVAAAEDDPEDERTELAARRPLPLSRATRLMRYAHSVHRYWENPAGEPPSDPGRFLVLLYRDGDDIVRCLELSPFAFAITRRLKARETLESAVCGACTEMNQVLDDATREELADLLDDYARRGVLPCLESNHFKTNGA